MEINIYEKELCIKLVIYKGVGNICCICNVIYSNDNFKNTPDSEFPNCVTQLAMIWYTHL